MQQDSGMMVGTKDEIIAQRRYTFGEQRAKERDSRQTEETKEGRRIKEKKRKALEGV